MLAVIRDNLVVNIVEGEESNINDVEKTTIGIVTFISDDNKHLVSVGSSYIDGEFFLPESSPIVLSEQEIYDQVAQNVRIQRNYLLSQTDIKMLYDNWSSMSSTLQDECISYRQELRDITLQDGFPFDVVWPVEPSEETISVNTGISTAGIAT